LFRICTIECITFNLAWVPRTQNEAADYLSKVVDPDDWSVEDQIFSFLEKTNQKFDLDVFASDKTSKCKKFYSKWWCAGTSGINAFCFDWSNCFCWIVPPPNVILETILHAIKHNVSGILIIPKWESAVFWPALYETGSLPEGWSILHEYVNPKCFFAQGEFANKMFTCKAFSGNVLVILLQQHNGYLLYLCHKYRWKYLPLYEGE
jgi:hypothetical protein